MAKRFPKILSQTDFVFITEAALGRADFFLPPLLEGSSAAFGEEE